MLFAMTRRAVLDLAAFAVIGLSLLPSSLAQAGDKGVVVFAAASLKDALDAINADWQKAQRQEGNHFLRGVIGARQADRARRAGRSVHLGGRGLDGLSRHAQADQAGHAVRSYPAIGLVLIAPKDSGSVTANIASSFPLASLLGDGRLAMADTQSVPAGKYGKAALEKLGVWETGVKANLPRPRMFAPRCNSCRAGKPRSAWSMPHRRQGRSQPKQGARSPSPRARTRRSSIRRLRSRPRPTRTHRPSSPTSSRPRPRACLRPGLQGAIELLVQPFVMPGQGPGHPRISGRIPKTWMAGTSPAMTAPFPHQ